MMARPKPHSLLRAAPFLSAAVLSGCVMVPAGWKGANTERSPFPRRDCLGLLGEATAALSSSFADTSAANVMSAHTHGVKMAEYHACLAEDP